MFVKGDRVKIRPEYGGSMEEFFGIERTTVLTVFDVEFEGGNTYLWFVLPDQMVSLLSEFFGHERKVGFSLNEVA